MTEFWLNDFMELFNTDNFIFGSKTDNYIKVLNVVALLSIVIGTVTIIITKQPFYFTIVVLVLSLTILLKSNISTTSMFTPTDSILNSRLSNSYDTGVYLTKAVNIDQNGLNNIIYVNTAFNFNKGDILAFSNAGRIIETNIVSDIQYTIDTHSPVIILLNNMKNNYSKYTTKILKVSDSSPNIFSPPDGNESIGRNNGTSDPMAMAVQNYPSFNLPNANRNDWNLELATMGVNGMPDSYVYQGQPYGNLKCRNSDTSNPMGVIQVPEYDAAPTMYGTCNVGELAPNGTLNNNFMTTNQEATVSQRVDDLLFHKGNAQSRFAPMPIDTLPNDQEAFGHFCYRNPTNLVNVKYGSVFMNDPEKFKLVTQLARASGTENGGGGGH
jgi:hypothetical protein